MRVYEAEDCIYVYDGKHTASVQLKLGGNEIYAYNLKSSGSVECLIRVLSRVKVRGLPVTLAVDDDHPKRDVLTKLYKRMGAKYVGKLYKVE